MIAHISHGYTTPTDAHDYEATQSRYPARNKGSARLFEQLHPSPIKRRRSRTVLLWELVDALRAFAGPDYELAIVPVERRRFLLHYDERSAHYEVVLQPACEPV